MYEARRAWLAQHRACETAEPVVHRVIDEIHRLAALEPGAPADAAAVAAAKAALLGTVGRAPQQPRREGMRSQVS